MVDIITKKNDSKTLSLFVIDDKNDFFLKYNKLKEKNPHIAFTFSNPKSKKQNTIYVNKKFNYVGSAKIFNLQKIKSKGPNNTIVTQSQTTGITENLDGFVSDEIVLQMIFISILSLLENDDSNFFIGGDNIFFKSQKKNIDANPNTINYEIPIPEKGNYRFSLNIGSENFVQIIPKLIFNNKNSTKIRNIFDTEYLVKSIPYVDPLLFVNGIKNQDLMTKYSLENDNYVLFLKLISNYYQLYENYISNPENISNIENITIIFNNILKSDHDLIINQLHFSQLQKVIGFLCFSHYYMKSFHYYKKKHTFYSKDDTNVISDNLVENQFIFNVINNKFPSMNSKNIKSFQYNEEKLLLELILSSVIPKKYLTENRIYLDNEILKNFDQIKNELLKKTVIDMLTPKPIIEKNYEIQSLLEWVFLCGHKNITIQFIKNENIKNENFSGLDVKNKNLNEINTNYKTILIKNRLEFINEFYLKFSNDFKNLEISNDIIDFLMIMINLKNIINKYTNTYSVKFDVDVTKNFDEFIKLFIMQYDFKNESLNENDKKTTNPSTSSYLKNLMLNIYSGFLGNT